jgi:ferredoxin
MLILLSLVTLACRKILKEEQKLADPNDRVGENASGTYYVDTQCIDCDVCRDTAPDNFTRSDQNGYSYVYKQPETEEERELCEEALAACPVEAIGNDG